MALRPILVYPDPILRQRCREVETFDGDLKRLVDDMVETMIHAPGVGLAAPQIGVDLRLAVVDVTAGKEPGNLFVLANPEIIDVDGEQVDFEACLSLPGLSEKISRPQRVRVTARDVVGREITVEAEDFLARAFCHEIDHLDGVLFFDHLRGLKKERARRKLRRLKRARERASA